MDGIRDMFERLTDYELLDVPVGSGVMLALADSIATALSDLARGFIGLPPIVTDAVLAWADARWRVMERLVGMKGQYLIDSILVKRGLDSQFNLTETISSWIGKLTGAVKGGAAGYEIGGYSAPELGATESMGDIVPYPAPGESSDVATALSARRAFFESMKR